MWKKKGRWQAAFLKSLQLIKANVQQIQKEKAEAPRFTLRSDVCASPRSRLRVRPMITMSGRQV